MNIRNHLLEVQCSQKEASDVAQALVHSLMFFRTHGKFNYKHEAGYSIGTLGYERVICEHIDFTYIRCSSSTLTNRINNKIQDFVDKLNENTHSGILSLEFYTKRPSRWPFNDTKMAWELWTIKLVIIHNNSPLAGQQPTKSEQQHYSDIDTAIRLEDNLSQKLLDIIKIVNSDKYPLPQMPTQPILDTVFDTSYSELQPYLYNISYKINENVPGANPGACANTKFMDGNIVTDSSTQSSLKKFLLGTLEL